MSGVVPAFDLSVRTFEEAAQVLELNGMDRQDVTATGAGGGGMSFQGRTPTFKPGFGKVLTATEVPLSNKPIKRAAMSHMCFLCSQEVTQGQEIWPVMKPEGVSVNPGGRKAAAHCWCHLECARSNAPDGVLSTPVCPHWLKKGVCSFGALCFYEHPEGLVAEVKAKADQPRRIGTWKRRVTRKSGKASIFRRWLIDNFGLELLSSGSGILDVAGGKGEVAFELVNLNRIPTTVVDPRILDLSSYKRKFEFGIFWRNPLMHAYIHPDVSSEAPVAAPQHLRVFLDDAFLDSFARCSAGDERHRKAADSLADDVEIGDDEKSWTRVFGEAVVRGHQVVWSKKGLINRQELNEENAYPTRKRTAQVEVRMAEASAGAEDDAGIPWAAAHTSGCGEQRQDREGGGEVWDEGGRMGQETGKGGDQREQREPKHLRRGRTRGVPVELRASRAGASRSDVAAESEADLGMEWAVSAFDALLDQGVGVDGQGEEATNFEDGGGEGRANAEEGGGNDEAAGAGREDAQVANDGDEILDAARAQSILQECSVVIGLHPDQAVGSLVDFALAHKKPFACIPCCVYWKSFPRRRMADGSQVRTYEQLVAWLRAKHPRIQETVIDFEGKNRLLWWRP